MQIKLKWVLGGVLSLVSAIPRPQGTGEEDILLVPLPSGSMNRFSSCMWGSRHIGKHLFQCYLLVSGTRNHGTGPGKAITSRKIELN